MRRNGQGGAVREPGKSRGSAWLPMMLVFLTLAALVIVPWVMQRKVNDFRTEVFEVLSPAHRLIIRVQFEMASEKVAIRAFLLTGDPEYAADYREARASKDEAIERLLSLSSRLETDVRPNVAALQTGLARAQPLLDKLFAGEISAADYVARLPEQQAIFKEELQRAKVLDDEFFQMEGRHRGAVGRLSAGHRRHRGGTRRAEDSAAPGLASRAAQAGPGAP